MLLVRATVSIILNTSSIVSLRPMMFENWCDRPEGALQQDVFLLEVAVLDLLAHLHLQQVDIERLAQVIARSEPHRLDGGLRRRKRRDHDPEDVRVHLLGGAEHVDAAHVRHLDVGDQQVERPAFQRGDSRTPVLGERHLVAFALEHDRQQFAHRPLVVHHKNARRSPLGGGRRNYFLRRIHVVTSARAGRRTETVVPVPGAEFTRI